jgi:predicted negative regulator of RcsB-dependent stress response
MGMGGMGGMGPEMQKLEMLRGYIDVVDRFTRLSRDPASAGVAAVVSASDILKQRGTDAAIEHFTKVLPEVKNEAVQRAIRIQLVDLYKQAGQADKALEQLDAMMKAAPVGAGMSGGAAPAP